MPWVGDIVYLADLDAVSELFRGDGELGHAGEANALLLPVAGPSSLLLLDGDRHLRERRLLTPAFHGPGLSRLAAVIEEAAAREVATWREAEMATRPSMQRITFEVIARAVLGEHDAAARAELFRLLQPAFDVSMLNMVPALRVDAGRLTPWGRFRAAMRKLDARLFALIRARRRQPLGDDVLGMLVHATDEQGAPLSDRHVRDELVTLLLAGHETTASALAWAFERLARHPRAVDRAREAVTRGELRYLDAIAKETLRVRPIVMDVARKLGRDADLAGYRLPAGTIVMPAIALLHEDDAHFAEAARFIPERWLDSNPPGNAWLPFGGGRRRCLGASLALLEMRLVLAKVLAERRPLAHGVAPERPKLRGITFVPERGGRVGMVRDPVRTVESPSRARSPRSPLASPARP
jgi:cytochrome P450